MVTSRSGRAMTSVLESPRAKLVGRRLKDRPRDVVDH